MTQEGICRGAGIDLRHFTQYVRPLVKEGLVRERLAHVKGSPQRLKAYELTDSGRMIAARLRESVKSETVRVKDATAIREEKVSEILAKVPGISILQIVRQATEVGTVDLAALAAPRGPVFIAMQSDAPVVDRFVGRQRELEALTSEADRPRIFVVRGVAGIGKSSLGAKACEALRGRCNIFWHRVRPWDTPQSLLAGLGDFLWAIGKPGLRSVLSRGETARAAQVLREDLVGSRSLLVIDDAHEASQDARSFLRILKEAIADAADVRALVLTREALPFYDRRDVALSQLVREMELRGLAPEDLASLVAGGPEAPGLEALGHQVGGHPLLVALLRANPTKPAEALQDVRRFVEEEIYTKLSEPERRMMKTAALYQVPVPREALLADPTWSQDLLLSLSKRSLLQSVGAEEFEVHDTIRAFFADLLTTSERRELVGFALPQLRRLVSQARERGDFAGCINYLWNAARLAASTEEQVSLWEELGDANRAIGDLNATLSAFGKAMDVASDPEAQVRLRRKRAQALFFWDRREEAAKDIEEALAILGEGIHVERGWLEHVRCQLADSVDEWEEAREHGQAALQMFRAVNDATGQINALTRLSEIEMYSPKGDMRTAERHLNAALELVGSVRDPGAISSLHRSLAFLFAHAYGDVDRAMSHLAAIERLPAIMGNPTTRAEIVGQRGWMNLDFRGDFAAARKDFEEAIALSRSVHDDGAVTYNQMGLSVIAFYEGRTEDAHREFESLATERAERGFLGSAADAIFRVAECCLLLGDIPGFRRASGSLDDPKLAQGIETRPFLVPILRGLDHLLRGEEAQCIAAFQPIIQRVEEQLEAIQRAESSQEAAGQAPSPRGWPRLALPYIPHLYYSVALRVMGREKEASEHLEKALDLVRAKGFQSRVRMLPEEHRWLVDALRAARSKS